MTCHGAGRVLSRHAAVREARGRDIQHELSDRGVVARALSRRGLAEEQSAAYKDVDSRSGRGGARWAVEEGGAAEANGGDQGLGSYEASADFRRPNALKTGSTSIAWVLS